MAGISSKAAGKLENRYKYNGIELDEDLGLDVYEAHFRNLDQQIGRWWQIDPKIEQDQENWSPYSAMADDPALKSDPLGDDPGIASLNLSFLKGVGQSIAGLVTGAAHAVTHLPETVIGLSKAYGNPGLTAATLFEAGKQSVNEFKNGDANVKAEMIGKATGDLSQMFIGTGEVKAATKTLEGAKVVEEATTVGKVSEAAKGLGNPFKNATLEEVTSSFEKRVENGTMTKAGPDPSAGRGAYVNNKSGYSYHIDNGVDKRTGKVIEAQHVDVNRANPKPKGLEPKRKLEVKQP